VADVLGMAALELGDPVSVRILMEADDAPLGKGRHHGR
jgi:hypothetical protein